MIKFLLIFILLLFYTICNSLYINQKKLILKFINSIESSSSSLHAELKDLSSSSSSSLGFQNSISNNNNNNNNSKNKKNKKYQKIKIDPIKEKEDIDRLEKLVAQKFWSREYEEEDNEEIALVQEKKERKESRKKVFGFFPNSGKTKLANDDQEEEENDSEDEEEDSNTSISIKETSKVSKGIDKYNKPTTTKSQPLPEFRLRRPVEVSIEDNEAAIAELKKKEEEKQKKIARQSELKLLNKHSYEPFDFNYHIEVPSSQDIFSNTEFVDIQITNDYVLENLEQMSIYNPTKIQELAIPKLSEGQNVILHAQTGSGKTLTYLLPLLNIIDINRRKVQAIVLAPSRELVTQIGKVAQTVFDGTGISVVTLIGGANMKNQIQQIRDKRPQIVVATPGRLAEVVFKYEKLKLGNVRAMILDEADNLLQDVFIDELRTLIEATPCIKRQQQFLSQSSSNNNDDMEEDEEQAIDGNESSITKPNKFILCLASATAKNNLIVQEFADQYCGKYNWETVAVPLAGMLPAAVTHGLISAPRIKGLEILRKLLNSQPEVQRALIFVNDPHRVQVVYEQLLEKGIVCAPLTGESSKDDRKEIMARIRDGRLKFVVTTELAARGLDIPDISHVINFELPADSQHYVHRYDMFFVFVDSLTLEIIFSIIFRAGRCGRAGKPGLVINFATPSTKFVIRRFGKQLGAKVLDCEIREGRVYLRKP
jgi:ATP-dependent RNA helicase DeaD